MDVVRLTTKQIPYPAELGEWSRQKDGLFKTKMDMSSDDLKSLQNAVRKATQMKFDRTKTARSQPQEVLDAIRLEVSKTHQALLDKYMNAWPVQVFVLAYVENRQAYEKRKDSIQSRKTQLATHTPDSPSSHTLGSESPESSYLHADNSAVAGEYLVLPNSQAQRSDAATPNIAEMRLSPSPRSTWSPESPLLFSDKNDIQSESSLERIKAITSFLYGSRLNATSDEFEQAFFLASREDNVYVMHALFTKSGADVNAALACGSLPLSITVRDGSFRCFHLLLRMDADACGTDQCCRSPLYLALFLKRHSAAHTLIDRGARCSVDDLVHLSEARRVDVVATGRSVDQLSVHPALQTNDGPANLFVAMHRDLSYFTGHLGHLGQQPAMVPPVIVTAAIFGHLDLIRTVLEKDIDAQWDTTTDITSALYAALYWEQYEVARYLINFNRTSRHYNQLQAAAKAGFLDIVEAMVLSDISVEPPDERDVSALHVALAWKRASVAQFLIRLGARCTYSDLVAALRAELPDTARLICEAGVHALEKSNVPPPPLSPSHPDLSPWESSSSESLPHYTIEHDSGCRGQCKNNASESSKAALQLAAYFGYTDIISWLIQRGAGNWIDFGTRSSENEGCTPLQMALENGHVDAAILLLQSGADVSKLHPRRKSPPSIMTVQHFSGIPPPVLHGLEHLGFLSTSPY